MNKTEIQELIVIVKKVENVLKHMSLEDQQPDTTISELTLKENVMKVFYYTIRNVEDEYKIAILKHLKNNGLTKEDAQADDNYALRISAQKGHLEVLKFLKEEFGLTKEDALANFNRALRVSVEKGNVEVLKYLKEGFGLTKQDTFVDVNWALLISVQNGHLEILKYLKEGFGLTKEEVLYCNNFIFTICIEKGHFNIIK